MRRSWQHRAAFIVGNLVIAILLLTTVAGFAVFLFAGIGVE